VRANEVKLLREVQRLQETTARLFRYLYQQGLQFSEDDLMNGGHDGLHSKILAASAQAMSPLQLEPAVTNLGSTRLGTRHEREEFRDHARAHIPRVNRRC